MARRARIHLIAKKELLEWVKRKAKEEHRPVGYQLEKIIREAKERDDRQSDSQT